MHNRLLQQSMESIHFQDGKFGAKMELIIQRIKDNKMSSKELADSPELKELEYLIYSNTGILVDLYFIDLNVAAAFVPTINSNHIFLNKAYDEYSVASVDRMVSLAKRHKEETIVDLKSGLVTGLFSKIKSPILMSFEESFLNKNLEPRHTVAILLHELGHLFTNYEYAARTITTNQCIALISKSLMNKTNVSQHHFVIEQVGELICKDKKSFVEFEHIDDIKILAGVIIDKSITQAKSELNTSNYDYSTCEYLADQYVARQGYGRELIERLDYSHKSILNPNYSATAGFFADFASTILGITAGLLTSAVVSPVVGLFVVGYLLTTQLMGSSYSNKDYTYDDVQTRLKRIREQVIQQLKNTGEQNEYKAKMLKTLDDTKEIIDKTRIHETIYEKIFLFVSKKNRDAKTAVQLQRDLEELASNELFVKAAKLSTLTT